MALPITILPLIYPLQAFRRLSPLPSPRSRPPLSWGPGATPPWPAQRRTGPKLAIKSRSYGCWLAVRAMGALRGRQRGPCERPPDEAAGESDADTQASRRDSRPASEQAGAIRESRLKATYIRFLRETQIEPTGTGLPPQECCSLLRTTPRSVSRQRWGRCPPLSASASFSAQPSSSTPSSSSPPHCSPPLCLSDSTPPPRSQHASRSSPLDRCRRLGLVSPIILCTRKESEHGIPCLQYMPGPSPRSLPSQRPSTSLRVFRRRAFRCCAPTIEVRRSILEATREI